MIKKIKKLFRNIVLQFLIVLFKLIYGKVEKITSVRNEKEINIKKVNFQDNISYEIYSIKNGRLYTDKFLNISPIINNKLIDEASIQIIENNLGDANKNIVLNTGTPKIKKNINGSVISLLNGASGIDNYWHWIFEVLPRIEIARKVFKNEEIDFFLLPDLKKKFQIETLDALNIPVEKRITSITHRHIQAKKLIISTHPYIFNKDAPEAIQKLPIWISKFYKNFFINKSTKDENFPKKIFIDRKDSKYNNVRAISNSEEIKDFLKKKNYSLINLSDFSFTDQIKLFNNAHQIIGLHGAGFANLMFCESETKVLELKSVKSSHVIENLAKTNNLKYDSINGSLQENTQRIQDGIIKISLDEIVHYLENN